MEKVKMKMEKLLSIQENQTKFSKKKKKKKRLSSQLTD